MIVEKFTPEALVSAPRRSPAVPNHDGTLALYTSSTHTIGGETLDEIRVIDIATGRSRRLFDDSTARDAAWLGDGSNTVVLLKKGGAGFTWIITIDAGQFPAVPHLVGHIPAPVQSLKVKYLRDGSVAFAVVGLAAADGHLFNSESNKPAHTAKVYDSYRVQEWDTYTNPQKYAIFYSTLVKGEDGWRIAGSLHNALANTTLEAPVNVYEPGDPRDDYDISQGGIVFAAGDPDVADPLLSGVSDIYHLPLASFSTASVQGPQRVSVQSEYLLGSSFHPRFSPDGSMIAFLRSPKMVIEETKIYVHLLSSPKAISVFDMITGKIWPLTPSGFEFSPNGHFLYITAEECGRVGLYKVDLQPNAYPETLLCNGSVTAYYPLSQGNNKWLLVTSSSLVESSLYHILEVGGTHDRVVVSAATRNGAKLGLSPKQVSEIYFDGAGDYCVHAWMIRPRQFDAEKKYPLAVLVHGGPNGAWDDQWSTRWNPVLWAEQGYVVVAPNITGSTGYGQQFTAAVRDNWGGRPYEDLVKCMDYLKHVPTVDVENAVIAGGGYGGYMMNWIQGHSLGRRFKAIVCQDGIFDLPTSLLQGDLRGAGSGRGDFGGEERGRASPPPPLLWRNEAGLERFNPGRAELVRQWRTPALVVHGGRGFRRPATDGLATFHALQALGTPSRFLAFPDEGQQLREPENELEWHRQVFRWVNGYTGAGAGAGRGADAM
ncbi:prolyl oligopeptidase [Durotheca rogersii]|uniref:prolyl oligopeptidase n=1 Tax=Durotheca rogersii TaxID=419775 RepID=UPI00221FD379|nr:prolyl oligopeptidase [Durotheca rogersii]KAI5866690.1 prolyl oligopeptidase [Durotheca rogersii]